MLVFKHAVSLSCLLAILSIMGLTLYTMVRQPSHQAVTPSLTTNVATVAAATPDTQLDQPAANKQAAPPTHTVAVPDTALTGAVDTAASALFDAREYSLATLEKQIHSRTNINRSQNNLPALQSDAGLAAVALAHSEDMLTENYFSHTDSSECDLSCRAARLPYQTANLGENLAQYTPYQAFSESELAGTFLDMWLKSTEHRDHLFSSTYTREGIGVAIKGDRIVVTVLFAE